MVAVQDGADSQAPEDPSADRGLYVAEEAADTVVDAILTKGGKALYGRYLRHKTCEFVADAVADAGLSSLRMCFVQHEGTDSAEDWALDEEPAIAKLDSWGGMAVPVRYVPKKARTASTISSKRSKDRSRPRPRARPGPAVLEVPMEGKRPTSSQGLAVKRDVRRSIIREECPRDGLEEELRALKVRKAAFRKQQEENERRRVMEEQERRSRVEIEQQDDADRGPCNVDEEGNVIFVDGIPPEKLVEVQTVPVYDTYQRTRRDAAVNIEAVSAARLRSGDRLARPHTSPAGTVKPLHVAGAHAPNATQRPAARQAAKKREAQAAVFTDSFEKIEAAQPPMHEIMSVEAGVTLDCGGVKKAGAQHAAEERMSRQEYAKLCEDSAVKKVPSDSRPASPEAPSGDEPREENRALGDRTPNPRRQPPRPHLQAPSLGSGRPATAEHGRLQPRQYSQAPSFGASRPATAPAPISTGTTPHGGPAGGALMPPGAVQREPLSPSASGARPMLPSGARRSDPESPTAAGALLSRPASGSKHGSAPGFWPRGWEDSAPIRAPRSASAAAAVQRAPAAPSWELRARQSRASLGSKPPPRYHAPQLGGSQLVGPAQPPPGATMGHGLLRSGSRNDFFYPVPQSAPRTSAAPSPASLPRQSSGGASRWRESGRPTPASTPARRDSGGARAADEAAAAVQLSRARPGRGEVVAAAEKATAQPG